MMAHPDNGAAGDRSGAVDGSMARLATSLLRAERVLTERLARSLEAERSSVDAWHVLSLLADGDRHTMSELAAAATVPSPSLTRLVDGLVADNLVYRRVDEHDRRRIRVHMTERGHELHRRLGERLARDAAVILAAATADDAEQLIDLLESLS